MNTQQKLNEQFRAYVCERHPDWSGHFGPSGSHDPENDFVSLMLFNPRGQEWPYLEAQSADGRLGVKFGLHHAHLAHEQVEMAIAECFELIEGIVQERIVTVILYQDGRPCVSDFCRVEDLPAVEAASRPPKRPGLLKRMLGMAATPSKGSEVTWRSYGPAYYLPGPPTRGRGAGLHRLDVVSWLGSHDRRTVLR